MICREPHDRTFYSTALRPVSARSAQSYNFVQIYLLMLRTHQSPLSTRSFQASQVKLSHNLKMPQPIFDFNLLQLDKGQDGSEKVVGLSSDGSGGRFCQ